MGRPPAGFDVPLRFGMRPSSAEALAALSASTGLSKTTLARVAVDRLLVDAGLIVERDIPATVTPKRSKK